MVVTEEVKLGRLGAQALYWLQVAIQKHFKWSDMETRLKTVEIEYYHRDQLKIIGPSLFAELRFTCSSRLAPDHIEILEIRIATKPLTPGKKVPVAGLPGYMTWLDEKVRPERMRQIMPHATRSNTGMHRDWPD